MALVEKGDTVRSGAGGPGCDHWCDAPANPLSRVSPDDWAQHMADRPYSNGIGIQIQCREDFDTLLEMEQMGGKIRDTENEYAGAEGRDDKTKFMISPRYGTIHSYFPDPKMGEPNFNPPEKRNNVVIRVWGSTFKPALKKECKRLGVKIFDRVMGTSLLTENGIQGARVVGATGLNNRTGEFMIFKSKATILSTAGGGSLWLMSMELGGYSNMHSRTMSGDGTIMAWKAGAELTKMESTGMIGIATGLKHKWYSGAGDASYENVPLVDAKGKRLPYPIQGWVDAGAMVPAPGVEAKIREGIMKGEYELPFYGDFPSMPDVERRATWNLMLGEESTTRIIIDTFNKAGFDISKDLLQSYKFIEGQSLPQWRDVGYGGGILVDWNLKTSLDGLYAAGNSDVRSRGPQPRCRHRTICRTQSRGLCPGSRGTRKYRATRSKRKKPGFMLRSSAAAVSSGKSCTPASRESCSIMSANSKPSGSSIWGLNALQKIEEESVPWLFALDPHKLMRSLEDLSMLEYAKIIIQASLARKASSMPLNFQRIDFPAMDPPEWNKFLTIKLENDKVKTGERPQEFWGDMKAAV